MITVKKNLSLTLISFFFYFQNIAQDIFKGYEHLFTPPLHYTAYRISDGLRIDGEIDEIAWEKAPWSVYFTNIEGDQKPHPAFNTRFKMLWNSSHLYIAAELEEPHVWATLTQHDQVIFHDNDFEVFIDPDGDTHDYFEIEVNALSTIFDLFLSKPYRNRGVVSTAWNAADLKTAVHVEGTLNDPGDKDKKWTVEMAIPFAALQNNNAPPDPKINALWRVNFSRVQWDTEIAEGKYKKKINPATGKPFPEHNWVWSPQGVINMHYPERWGYLRFANEAKTGHDDFALPPEEQSKKYLWLLYYKQKEYLRNNGKYAGSLSQLELPPKVTAVKANDCTLRLSSGGMHFNATLACEGQEAGWQIDQEGKIIPLK